MVGGGEGWNVTGLDVGLSVETEVSETVGEFDETEVPEIVGELEFVDSRVSAAVGENVGSKGSVGKYVSGVAAAEGATLVGQHVPSSSFKVAHNPSPFPIDNAT